MYTHKLVLDPEAENPREWDNLGTMVCFHKRYRLGDKTDFKVSQFKDWEQMGKHLERYYNAICVTPLYLYDHGGLTVSTGPFSCPFDSGQIGYIYADRRKVVKEFGTTRTSKKIKEEVKQIIEQEVKIYDAYLSGDVWSVQILDADGEVVDVFNSAYGYEDAIEMAKEYLKEWNQCPASGGV